MLITLSNEELTTAVKQYLGNEYDVSDIKFVTARSAGNSTKAEVSATRAEVEPYPLPKEDEVPWVDDGKTDGIIDVETVEKHSLFPSRDSDG